MLSKKGFDLTYVIIAKGIIVCALLFMLGWMLAMLSLKTTTKHGVLSTMPDGNYKMFVIVVFGKH